MSKYCFQTVYITHSVPDTRCYTPLRISHEHDLEYASCHMQPLKVRCKHSGYQWGNSVGIWGDRRIVRVWQIQFVSCCVPLSDVSARYRTFPVISGRTPTLNYSLAIRLSWLEQSPYLVLYNSRIHTATPHLFLLPTFTVNTSCPSLTPSQGQSPGTLPFRGTGLLCM